MLDNHRCKLVRDYYNETSNELYTHGLTKDTIGVVAQYVIPSYPLKKEWPLTHLDHIDDGMGSDSDDDN